MGVIVSASNTIQQAIQNHQPKGDAIATISTIGAVVNAIANVAAPIFTAVAAILGIVWWVMRIVQTRQETKFAKEKHEKDMGR